MNDLYVRFFRMAERRIAEKTGRGVVCFISNYSWLDGLSFTGMRERYLEAFDAIRIDNLQWRQVQDRQDDARRQARPEHLLATGTDPVGIQVGTAIARCAQVRQRHRIGGKMRPLSPSLHQAKREELDDTAEAEPVLTLYQFGLFDAAQPAARSAVQANGGQR